MDSGDMRKVLKGPNGEFKVDTNTHIIVHCSDGNYMEIPKEQAANCPFIHPPSGQGHHEIEYPAAVLESLVRWVSHYGVDGKCASTLPVPCTYRDMKFILKDDWDDDFYNRKLFSNLTKKVFLVTMNAAEKYKIEGLLDLMATALGCILRSEDRDSLNEIMGIAKGESISEEEINAVEEKHPWVNEATKPRFME
ncbi:hypothetical protein STCU_01457 [Strigomonas culicis]|uniref:S-phase kinase-associated protein 1 n=1 Tax=Strigomonas culicis TaxID=28005 RepID=S9WFZ6_9TRYP|nr:hypothetical protein STCU_03922 [Strigomonas culicis]EPY34645.1 hypothetical protein STCU_01457 [Strigomonas culicis]|eukprot:EPY30728.1 hypothetical protein STCU_03922 [Strigomonas culicis]